MISCACFITKQSSSSSRLAPYETSPSTDPDVRLSRIRLLTRLTTYADIYSSKHGFLPLSVALRSPPLCAVEISLRNIAPCSPLPSSGITRFHRYYETVRLPVNHLPSFVSCPAYHITISLCFPSFRNGESGSSLRMDLLESTGSPQLMQHHCVTWLTSDPAALRCGLTKTTYACCLPLS